MSEDLELLDYWDYSHRHPEFDGYEGALRATGCEVRYYDRWGDYQGTWLALVVYQGENGVVSGDYGSCAGCDHWESWRDDHNSKRTEPEWREQLAKFGELYLPPKPLRLFIENLQAEVRSWADHDHIAQLAWIEGVLVELDPDLAMELVL